DPWRRCRGDLAKLCFAMGIGWDLGCALCHERHFRVDDWPQVRSTAVGRLKNARPMMQAAKQRDCPPCALMDFLARRRAFAPRGRGRSATINLERDSTRCYLKP